LLGWREKVVEGCYGGERKLLEERENREKIIKMVFMIFWSFCENELND
jgi:hypothetical protein